METKTEAQRAATGRTFKSYYVVWKPDTKYANIWMNDRLNRTMQYGNDGYACSDDRWADEFKSYYVVWKPHKIPEGIQTHRV